MVSLCGSWWLWDNSLMETSTLSRCWTSSNKDTEFPSPSTVPMNSSLSLPVVGLCLKTNGQVLGRWSCVWRTSLMLWAILSERKISGKYRKRRRHHCLYGVSMSVSCLLKASYRPGSPLFYKFAATNSWQSIKEFTPTVHLSDVWHYSALGWNCCSSWPKFSVNGPQRKTWNLIEKLFAITGWGKSYLSYLCL